MNFIVIEDINNISNILWLLLYKVYFNARSIIPSLRPRILDYIKTQKSMDKLKKKLKNRILNFKKSV